MSIENSLERIASALEVIAKWHQMQMDTQIGYRENMNYSNIFDMVKPELEPEVEKIEEEAPIGFDDMPEEPEEEKPKEEKPKKKTAAAKPKKKSEAKSFGKNAEIEENPDMEIVVQREIPNKAQLDELEELITGDDEDLPFDEPKEEKPAKEKKSEKKKPEAKKADDDELLDDW